MHNKKPSLAVDVAPYPINWNDVDRFYHFAGYVEAIANQMNIKIIWGGDWNKNHYFDDQKFNDLVHYELIITEKKEKACSKNILMNET